MEINSAEEIPARFIPLSDEHGRDSHFAKLYNTKTLPKLKTCEFILQMFERTPEIRGNFTLKTYKHLRIVP